MADNVTLDAGAGGDTIAADDVGGAKHQRVKVEWGTDGTATEVAAGVAALPIQDGGNSITVDGTITAVTTITNVVHIDDNASSLTVDGTVTATIAAAATTIAKAEDAAHSSADVGVMALAVRQATATDLSAGNTDGDYEPLQVDASGRLHVNAGTVTVAAHAVTNAGTFAVQVDGSALTALQLIDDVVFAEDVAAQAADKGISILAVRRDADTTLVGADNDYAQLQVNAAGQLKVEAFSGETLPVSLTSTTITGTVAVTQSGTWDEIGINDSGNSITVDGTVTATIAAGAATIAKAEDSVHSSGDVGVMMLAVRQDSQADFAADGDYVPLSIDDSGNLRVVSTGGAAGVQYTEGDTDASITGNAMLWEDAGDTLVVASAANPFPVEIVAGAGSGGTAAADDADFTATSTSGTPVMGVYESTPTSVTDGDMGIVGITATRALKASIVNATIAVTQSGTWDEIGINDSGNSITVDNGGTFAVQATVAAAATSIAKAEDAAHSDGDVGVLSLALRRNTASSTSNADNDYQPLITNTTGHLWVDASGQTLTVASHAVTNAGTFATQVDGAALTALQLIDNTILVDDAAFTPATSSVSMVGFQADETATDSVDEGDAGAARMTLDRKVIVTAQPHTSGGLSTFMASGSDGSSILVATAQAVKASAGQLYGYYLYNPEAAVTFVHFYNTAAGSVTVGTTNPLFTLPIPAGAAANLMFTNGVAFSNAGWSIAATTTAGGNTAPATGVSATIWYM